MTATLSEVKDRIVGSILGVFIGDALAVGVHWQYDLDKLERERGYVTDYLDPLPGTYHSGTDDAPGRGKLQAGELEQQGVIDKLLLESLVKNKGLDQPDFLQRLEDEILKEPTMDGTREGGKYGWTDKTICDLYKGRIVDKVSWEECIPERSDTPDAVVRAALIGALYFQTPRALAKQANLHASYATKDSTTRAHAVAFAAMVAAVIQGAPLDNKLTGALYGQAGKSLPFSSIVSNKDFEDGYGQYSEPDSLIWYGMIAKGAQQVKVEPAHRAVQLYGQFCAFYGCIPSAYYCTARFADSFEDAILCSINGGGQNTMRSSIVGALLGAKVGRSGIPSRFIDGLADSQQIIELAEKLADIAIQTKSEKDAWEWEDESFGVDPAFLGSTSRTRGMG